MTEAQRQAVHAVFQISTWNWVRLADVGQSLDADALADCVEQGLIDYDALNGAVRTTWPGREAAGLPGCVFPRRFS